ncbi:MAG: helix-turn-helix domain-containing protein [Ruminococcaceae bacterium]|nr:helix-turn-helix domain-containing protein [Oscillospiraceae bacterium]
MNKLFEGWKWGGMSVHNVVSVKTGRAGMRIKGHGNTRSYQLGVKFNGRSQMSYHGVSIDFTPGSALFLPKEETENIDYVTVISEKGSGVCIFFDSELPLPREPQMLRDIGGECENAFLRLLNVYLKGDRQGSPELMAAFYGLLSALFQRSVGETDGERRDTRFDGAIDHMKRHICDAYPNIEHMAKLSGMGEKYFRDSFKISFGISPLQYFHRQKTEYIKLLIADLSLSVAEVAKRGGFSDPNYFSRFFKKHTGVSPRAYRNYYCKKL